MKRLLCLTRVMLACLIGFGFSDTSNRSAQGQQSVPESVLRTRAASKSRPAKRARDLGIQTGILPVGKLNAITDVSGVMVGHQTLIRGDSIRTGVTIIKPHNQNLYQRKVPAAVWVGNGFGKLAGSTQVDELGNIETPIALTNTLSVSTCMKTLVSYTLRQSGNESVRSVNAIVGETNDGFLNDIRGMHVKEKDVLSAIESAQSGAVPEGNVGAGTGTRCFGFKGGIGTSSRKLPNGMGGYTVGVLVQTNFGGILRINGAPVGRELGKFSFQEFAKSKSDGSCMIVVATDAPLSDRNLKRLAKRALFGMARTGSINSNGSGDYVIAFSTAYHITRDGNQPQIPLLNNEKMNPLFLAVAEAAEESIYNSMFAATTLTGRNGNTAEAIPVRKTIEIIEKYNLLNLNDRLPRILK